MGDQRHQRTRRMRVTPLWPAVLASSAPVVTRPVRRAACGDGVIEDLVLVSGARDAVLAGRAAVLFPGAQQELVSPTAVAGSPGVAAALFGVADADPKR